MLKRKLRSSRGETLTEILAAIVLCGIAVLMMVTMVVTAMGVNYNARTMDIGTDGTGGFYGALSQVETHTFTSADPACSVKLSGPGRSDITPSDVYSYTDGTNPSLTAYGKEVGP